MQLGTLLQKLQVAGSAAEALDAIGDLPLYARVCEMAERFEEDPGEYVAASVARFAARAGDEAWVGLVGAMEQAEDPGRAALKRILLWALDADAADAVPEASACRCGAGDGVRHGPR